MSLQAPSDVNNGELKPAVEGSDRSLVSEHSDLSGPTIVSKSVEKDIDVVETSADLPQESIEVPVPIEAQENGETSSVRGEDVEGGAEEAAGSDVGSAEEIRSRSPRSRRGSAYSASGSESESDCDRQSDYFEDIVDASRLGSKGLYQAYVKKLEKRRFNRDKSSKGPKLVRGLVDYLRVLEDRIDKLEMNQRDDSSVISIAPPEAPEADTLDRNGTQTRFYNFVDEPEFTYPDNFPYGPADKPGSFLSGSDSKNVVRVLYKWRGEPTELPDDGKPNPIDIDLVALRLDSIPLTAFFRQPGRYVQENGPPVPPGHSEWNKHLLLLSKPYRILIRSLTAIKKQLADLEAKYRQSTEPSGDSPADQEIAANEITKDTDTNSLRPVESMRHSLREGSVKPPGEPWETEEALGHFRELMDFMNMYLHKEIRIYDDLRSGTATKVEFEHVWMLFDTGDTIYCPTDKGDQKMVYEDKGTAWELVSRRRDVPQAYRVLATTGGIPLVGQLGDSKDQAQGVLDPWTLLQAEEIALRNAEGKTKEDGTNLRDASQRAIASAQQEGVQAPKQKNRDRFSPFYISCYHIDYDGKRIRTAWDFFVLRPFEGEVQINSLSVFPLRYHPSQQQKDFLVERGRRFVNYTPITHLNYDGLTVGGQQEEVRSPIMVDFQQASQIDTTLIPSTMEPDTFWQKTCPLDVIEMAYLCDNNCRAPYMNGDYYVDYQKASYGKTIPRLNTILEEFRIHGPEPQLVELLKELEAHDLLVLLPGVVPGFALRNRKWHLFDVKYISDIQTDNVESGWKDLVLPKGHRSMVQSMVQTHSADTRTSRSTNNKARSEIGLVQGKGKGCIILLHGPPGVGKTSTAECVAAYTRRPLYPITSGDIGYEPDDVDKKLEELFRLGHRWGCVLLIDEADVFLAERDKADVKRNGLVSVFLRVLEYYSGILFLTTNRVGAIDDAFRSRIHLTLYYPKLDDKQSHRVWKTSIRRLARMNRDRVNDGAPKIDMDKKMILKFGDMNYKTLGWNGRQIQNAFQTALALAQFEVRKTPELSPEITVEHFKTIARASIQFDDYLKEVHIGDEAKNAKTKRIRNDAATAATARKVELPSLDNDSDSSSSVSSEEESESDSDAKKKKKKAKAKKKAKESSKGEDKAAEKAAEKAKRKKAKAKQVDTSDEEKVDKRSKSKSKKSKDEDESSGFDDSED